MGRMNIFRLWMRTLDYISLNINNWPRFLLWYKDNYEAYAVLWDPAHDEQSHRVEICIRTTPYKRNWCNKVTMDNSVFHLSLFFMGQIEQTLFTLTHTYVISSTTKACFLGRRGGYGEGGKEGSFFSTPLLFSFNYKNGRWLPYHLTFGRQVKGSVTSVWFLKMRREEFMKYSNISHSSEWICRAIWRKWLLLNPSTLLRYICESQSTVKILGFWLIPIFTMKKSCIFCRACLLLPRFLHCLLQ